MRTLKTLIAAATLLAGIAAAARPAHALHESGYLPTEVGYEWTFSEQGVGAAAQPWKARVSERRTDPTRGYVYFKLAGFNGREHWVRQTTTGRVYEATSNEWYRFGAVAGSAAWTFK